MRLESWLFVKCFEIHRCPQCCILRGTEHIEARHAGPSREPVVPTLDPTSGPILCLVFLLGLGLRSLVLAMEQRMHLRVVPKTLNRRSASPLLHIIDGHEFDLLIPLLLVQHPHACRLSVILCHKDTPPHLLRAAGHWRFYVVEPPTQKGQFGEVDGRAAHGTALSQKQVPESSSR